MIIKPILILGAPRSGTSLLQKILRNYPELWSLPSESELIWDQYCHPRLHHWESEYLTAANMTPQIRAKILKQFEQYLCPAAVWQPIEKQNFIWRSQRWRWLRQLLRPIYQYTFPIAQKFLWHQPANKRIVEKTISNSLRLGFVNEVFPDAKIIYLTRDGRNNINSLINAWLHPNRFFSYRLPVQLNIKGYCYEQWKFVLPPGWRDYIDRPLEDVCAFQWQSCHQLILKEIAKPKYAKRVLRVKLEDLTTQPQLWLKEIVEFVELPYDDYFESMVTHLPIVNSPDNDTSMEKWKQQHREQIERVMPMIKETMQQLEYQ